MIDVFTGFGFLFVVLVGSMAAFSGNGNFGKVLVNFIFLFIIVTIVAVVGQVAIMSLPI
jgi:hypothetical protein